MPNRDHEDSQYNRYEGRFESREERGHGDQGRGARDWERRDDFGGGYARPPARFGRDQDDYGSARYAGEDRGYQPHDERGSFDDRGARRYEGGQRGSLSSPNWYDERREAQRFAHQQEPRFGNQDWNRGQGQGGYGAGFRPEPSPEWNRSLGGGGNFQRPDYSRVQSNYGARDASTTQQRFAPSFGGPRDEGRNDESFGQQLRHAGQQVARSVKRAFRGPKGYKRSDERLREDVSDRLALQDDVDPSDIEVSVNAGEVTLTGTVQSRHEKFLAEEIADGVSGVTEVHNQLRVRREDAGISATPSALSAGLGLTAENGAGTGPSGGTAEALRPRNARA